MQELDTFWIQLDGTVMGRNDEYSTRGVGMIQVTARSSSHAREIFTRALQRLVDAESTPQLRDD
jgi:hypothetical protein